MSISWVIVAVLFWAAIVIWRRARRPDLLAHARRSPPPSHSKPSRQAGRPKWRSGILPPLPPGSN
jgi:hypothetical protein